MKLFEDAKDRSEKMRQLRDIERHFNKSRILYESGDGRTVI